jgi:PIN domain nuclease of toxin-antitoxin system
VIARYVIDTHALIWHLLSQSNLSPKVRDILVQADRGKVEVIIPTIVLVEIVYLAEKGRVAQNLVQAVLQLLQGSGDNYQTVPLDLAVVQSLAQIPRDVVPDMPDRIIAATAFSLNLPLLSRDQAITRATKIKVVW